MVNCFPQRVLGLCVVDRERELRVHKLSAMHLSGSVVVVVRAPHSGAAVFDVVGNLYY